MSKAMQARSISYLDWSRQFSDTNQLEEIKPSEKKSKNSLGIDKNEFKKFLGAWKEKNSII
ncbi:MAG: hypothetical protein ACFFAS_12000 [Promethearchaeota archaeon]